MAFNRKANKTAEELASAEILDSDEQDAIVKDLEREASEQDSTLRTVSCFTFRAIAGIFALLFLYSAYMPMSMDHQSVFQDIVPHLGFQIFYIFTGLNFMNFGNFIKDKGLPNPRRYFSYITIAIMISAWCFIFFQHSVTNVALYWLPLSNLGGLLLALYIDYDLKSVSASVNNLNNAKYVFKKP